MIDAFKSSGWLVGAGAIRTAVGGKLTVFDVLLSGILNKFGRQGLPSLNCQRRPGTGNAGRLSDRLRRIDTV
ncbi:hypothetical protein [Streptomyces albicerus]|uniref:hypothetical protein n=1 Tax=Streptomyces albicerus TaxID=2569859 RepID=UPI00124B5EB5|nr:hypothetical protein [Streptomyces albicerus]